MKLNEFNENFMFAFRDTTKRFLHLKKDFNIIKPNKINEYNGIIFNIKSNILLSHITIFLNEHFFNNINDFQFKDIINNHFYNIKTYESTFNNKKIYFPNPFFMDSLVEFYNITFFLDLLIFHLNKITNNQFSFGWEIDDRLYKKVLYFLKRTNGKTNFKHNLTLFECNTIYLVRNKTEFDCYFGTRDIELYSFGFKFEKARKDNLFKNSNIILGIPNNFKIYF